MGCVFPNGEPQFSIAALVLAMSFSHHHGDAIRIPVATCPGLCYLKLYASILALEIQKCADSRTCYLANDHSLEPPNLDPHIRAHIASFTEQHSVLSLALHCVSSIPHGDADLNGDGHTSVLFLRDWHTEHGRQMLRALVIDRTFCHSLHTVSQKAYLRL